MTLPSNLSTTEPAAIPSDPFACLGTAPVQADGIAPQGASFDRVLSQADDGARSFVPLTPLVGSAPVVYPSLAYMNMQVGNAAPAVMAETAAENAEATDDEVQADLDEQPESAKTDGLPAVDMMLAYQLIAGQWVPQSVVAQPKAVQDKTGDDICLRGQSDLPGESNSGQAPVTPVKTLSQQQSTDAAVAALGKKNTEALGQAILAQEPKPARPVESKTAADNLTSDAALKTTDETEKPFSNLAQVADFKTPLSPPEKIAAPSLVRRADFSSGVNSLKDGEEKKTLTVDGKKVATTGRGVGTGVANREFSMPYSVANKPASAAFSTTPSFMATDGIQAGTTATVGTTDAASTVQAPRLVEEIRAIADRISVIDRNSVEVRFDFNDSERLSVRVEYRDGTVHTTFRTDSSQLRDVISHEWQAQAAASDQRSYRVADPVFNSPDSTQKEFASHGDGSSRQRAFEQPAQSGAPSFAATGRNAGSTTNAAAPSPAARLETSRHLHTFA